MAQNGKKYRAVSEKVEDKVYGLPEAVDFLKSNPTASFNETLELAFRLGVDPRKSDQAVRGTVNLPHGSGKNVRVAVFASGAAADAAREAGADIVGNEDLIEKVSGGWLEFDVAVATPEAMKEVRKLGKVLGPRGLMPNPKTGTVTDDTAQAVQASKAGRVEFRMDRHGNVHVPCGKLSFSADQLLENAQAVIASVIASKPSTAKGHYIKKVSVSSTMGVGLQVGLQEATA
ncbi:MAG: 50S ribosomal protein L1 [Verrucomicrobia bacterium]|nr:50S ribosomal protein L1 [Verrucomicrobiota bacterium]MDA1085756.1 50S ribosomal protein L1 [Verrucomicrobiota bacterium]